MKHLVLNFGEKIDGKKCYVVIDRNIVILDDVYKVEDQLALQEKIEELNNRDVYVGLVVISSRHINKIDIRESYVLRIKMGVENSRSIIFEDNNNMTQLVFEE